MATTLQKRVEVLENTTQGRIAHAKASGDFKQLSDAELDTVIEQLEKEVREQGRTQDGAAQ